MRFGRVRRVHFVGIGGSGMSGIAEVLLNLGYRVSGSDLNENEATRRLAALGAAITLGHTAAAVADADVVVVSTAIDPENPEIAEAHRLRVPVIPRAEMLGELMRMKYSVAVAGSHGKTSTTSMIAQVMTRCGLDPTVVIGGKLEMFGSSAKLGSGSLLIAEADESDGSFLRLFPTWAVVTGIDREHLDHHGDVEQLRDAFVRFLKRVPFHGAVVACLDDRGVQAILPRLDRRVVTYGLTAQADFRALEIVPREFGVRFTFRHGNDAPISTLLHTPGRHQVQNALATLAVAWELGLALPVAAAALEGFPGADRRMTRRGEAGGVLVVDDYGHHPTEIRATLAALREAVAERRIVVLFQPHRYTRLEALFDEFTRSFYDADQVVVADVYAAGEAPRPGVDAERLATAIAEHGHRGARYGGSLADAVTMTLETLAPGDVLLTLGAGSVGKVHEEILRALGASGAARG